MSNRLLNFGQVFPSFLSFTRCWNIGSIQRRICLLSHFKIAMLYHVTIIVFETFYCGLYFANCLVQCSKGMDDWHFPKRLQYISLCQIKWKKMSSKNTRTELSFTYGSSIWICFFKCIWNNFLLCAPITKREIIPFRDTSRPTNMFQLL